MASATDNRMTEQTAMERFRAALEKRGIEFDTNDDECAEGEERTTVFKANLGESEFDIFVTAKDWYFDGELTPWLDVEFHNALTPDQAILVTLGEKPRDKTEEWLLDACNQATNDYVAQLKELVQDWQALYEEPDYGDCCRLRKRMQELGIEVIDE